MPSDIAGLPSAASIQAGRQALNRLPATGAANAVNRTQLSQGIRASQFIKLENKPLLNIAEAETALSTGLFAARGILDSLEVLRGSLQSAQNTALTSPNANLLDGNGSRFSRVNIQSQTRILLGRIESLINEAAYGGANFISSDQSVIRVQTSNFGGEVAVNTQPLNPDSLGLTSRNLISDRDLQEFLTQLNEAIIIADLRLTRLEEIERAVTNARGDQQALARALSGGASNVVPTGSLINLFG